MAMGDGLVRVAGYPFEVRHSAGARARAIATADTAAAAHRFAAGTTTSAASLAALLTSEVSPTLGHAVGDWDETRRQ